MLFTNTTFYLQVQTGSWKAIYCSRVFPHCPSCLSNKFKIRKLELSSNTRMQTRVFTGCVLKPEKRPATPDSTTWHVHEKNFSLRINEASGLIIIALIWVLLCQKGHRRGALHLRDAKRAPPYRSSAAHGCWCIAPKQWAAFPAETKWCANDKDGRMRARTRGAESFKERPPR